MGCQALGALWWTGQSERTTLLSVGGWDAGSDQLNHDGFTPLPATP